MFERQNLDPPRSCSPLLEGVHVQTLRICTVYMRAWSTADQHAGGSTRVDLPVHVLFVHGTRNSVVGSTRSMRVHTSPLAHRHVLPVHCTMQEQPENFVPLTSRRRQHVFAVCCSWKQQPPPLPPQQ